MLFKEQVIDRHQALKAARDYSDRRISDIRQVIKNASHSDNLGIHSLAVAGSLARREASEVSDLDLIITTISSKPSPDTDILVWRDELCDKLKIEKPNPVGVFATPICQTLIESISGGADEHYSSVAKRVLFLLESEWLFNETNYNALLNKIVDAYAIDVTADPRKNFVFLLNDVVRFFRALCVNYQHTKSETSDGKWPLRNVKLRHSRVLMYFSMIAAIGSLSRERSPQKIDALKILVKIPPLERLFVAYQLADDGAFYKVAGFYDTFLALLSNSEVREELKGLDYDDRYKSRYFAQLKANSDALSSELLRFYEARRQVWDDRFFEYMIL
ncbi:hypothetical protein [Gluconobacter sphaericus]|uniref:hypothetical protein n=1 Tax=Gluconobacter sphaericus TaxID=574987 RepID=UPI00312B6E87